MIFFWIFISYRKSYFHFRYFPVIPNSYIWKLENDIWAPWHFGQTFVGFVMTENSCMYSYMHTCNNARMHSLWGGQCFCMNCLIILIHENMELRFDLLNWTMNFFWPIDFILWPNWKKEKSIGTSTQYWIRRRSKNNDIEDVNSEKENNSSITWLAAFSWGTIYIFHLYILPNQNHNNKTHKQFINFHNNLIQNLDK